jgi:hypothetical protein
MDPLKSDFRNFLYLVWQHLGLPDPTPVQYDIAHFLQHGPRQAIVCAFRGVGKSYVTGAFVCWLLYCNPQLKILLVSASKAKADELSFFIKRLIDEMPIVQHLRPDPAKGQRDSVIMFDVGPATTSIAPSVKSVGITGQITGSRADIIIADDVETPKNSETELQREKLRTLVEEFGAVRKVEDTTRTIYLGTPQTEMSLYNHLTTRGYSMRVWPVRIPEKIEKYSGRLAQFIMDLIARGAVPGDPVDPKRFSSYVVQEKEGEYGRSGFTLQFMLDTSIADADRYPLKLADLIVFDCDLTKAPFEMAWGSGSQQVLNDVPNVGLTGDRYHSPMFIDQRWTPYEGIVMAVDPSGRGTDEVGWAVVALLHSRLFLLDAGGFTGGYQDDNLQSLAVIARRYKASKVIVEPNFGDGMFNKLLAPVLNAVYPCTIEDTERSITQKEKRIIDCLEPIMNQHRLVIDRRLIDRDYHSVDDRASDSSGIYRLFYQMTRITREKGSLRKDDRIDALALAVHYWTSIMSQDTAQAADEHRTRLLEEDVERYFSTSGPLKLVDGTPAAMWGRA